MTPVAARVDVHTHLFPRELASPFDTDASSGLPELRLRADGRGEIVLGGRTFRHVGVVSWDPARRIERMDKEGIDVQVLSPVPVTLIGGAPAPIAARWARRQNELLAEIACGHGGRFVALGMVAMQHVDDAIAELEYAVTQLRLPGVEIGTHCAGMELDDERLRPFFAAAQSLDAALFVHPTDGGGAIRRAGRPFEFGLGMLTDTAMAATALVFGGVLEQFPSLRIALAHGCGTFAWSLPRLVRGAGIGGPPADGARIDALVRSLWVDALVFEPAHLPLLVQRFGAEHVMLGSDFPFYDRAWGSPAAMIEQAANSGLITGSEAGGMYGSNALAFLAAGGTNTEQTNTEQSTK
jgi:aminocarboxymuconate-semialdehyde decarboxylase